MPISLVLPDPRTSIPLEVRRQKYDVIVKVGRRIEVVAEAVDRIQKTRKAIDFVLGQIKDRKDDTAKSLKNASEDLKKRLTTIADKFADEPDRVQGITRRPNTASARLGYVLRSLSSSWDAVTPTQETYLRQAKIQIEKEKQGNFRQRLLSLLEGLGAARNHASRLVVRSGGRVFFLKTDEIDWIEAAGNYVRLHAGADNHLLRETMRAIQKKLDPHQFIRIHRSTFVNIEKIKELQPWFHGEHVVILRDGTQLTMSRSYCSNLPELLGTAL